MELKDLTPEQRAKITPDMTAEELLELAKAEGIELSAEELDEIVGGAKGKGKKNKDGWLTDNVVCFKCGKSYDRMKMKKCPYCGCERSNPV